MPMAPSALPLDSEPEMDSTADVATGGDLELGRAKR
jgi:hypothetical protein